MDVSAHSSKRTHISYKYFTPKKSVCHYSFPSFSSIDAQRATWNEEVCISTPWDDKAAQQATGCRESMWHTPLLQGTNGRGAQLIHRLLPSGTKVLPRLQYDDMIGQHRCRMYQKKTYTKIWHQKENMIVTPGASLAAFDFQNAERNGNISWSLVFLIRSTYE